MIKKEFADHAFALFRRDIFLFVFGLVLSIILARKLGPSVFGLWMALQLIHLYADAFARLKFEVSAVYFLGREEFSFGSVVRLLNVTAVLSSAVYVGVLVLVFDWYQAFFLKGYEVETLTIVAMCVYIPCNLLAMNYKYLCLHREDTRTYNQMLLIEQLLGGLIGVCLVFILEKPLLALALGWLVSMVFSLLVGYLANKAETKQAASLPDIGIIRAFVSHSWPIYLASLGGLLNTYMVSSIVAVSMPASALSFYNLGKTRAELVLKVSSAVGTILYPVLSKEKGSDGWLLACSSFRISLIVMTLIGLLGAVFIYPVVYVLYGEEYLPLTMVFWVMLPGLVIQGATSLLGQFFLSEGRTRLFMIIGFVPILPQIGLAAYLIPRFDLAGAAVVSLLTSLLLSLVTIVVFLRHRREASLGDLVPVAADVRIFWDFVLGALRKRWPNIIGN